jgi:cytochrome c-type biogenesis protein CcmH
MIQFGIFVALFIAIALCFLLIPLWLKPKIVLIDDSQINIQLAQQKLQLFEADLANGVITQAQFEPLKNELMLNLHHDLKQIPAASNGNEAKGRWLAIPLAIFVPLLAMALYSVKGDLRAFDDAAVNSEMNAKLTATDINGMVEKLAKKMEENPNDSEGWIMLARSYKVLKRYPEAVEALRKARALTGEEPETLLQLADVIAMKNGGSLLGEPSELAAKALALDANNDMALWLYGLANAEDGKFNEAISYWKKLQTHYKPEEADYLEVQKLIDQAREALGQTVEVQSEVKVATSGKSIRVLVTLDDKFKASANSEDFVFIYAQPAQGGKMPLAVVKKQVKDLPLEITLDDSMAMMPAMTISSAANVQVSARISHSGNASPQTGEPIGKKQVSTLIDNGVVNLVIAETVP